MLVNSFFFAISNTLDPTLRRRLHHNPSAQSSDSTYAQDEEDDRRALIKSVAPPTCRGTSLPANAMFLRHCAPR